MSYRNLSLPDLIQACLKNDQEAWKEFRARFHQVISLAVLRTARRWGNTSNGLMEDLIGDTYLKLCADNFKLLRNFEFRTESGLYGFLKVIATNVTHDYFRHPRPDPAPPPVEPEDAYVPDPPDQDAVKDIERNVLMNQVERILFKVTGLQGERDRTIFWLYYQQGFTAKQIAELFPSLTTKGVESVIHRLTKDVRRLLTDEDADDPGDAA
jgi:RNA polymerase sigma-70 factor (ECF subfamily)